MVVCVAEATVSPSVLRLVADHLLGNEGHMSIQVVLEIKLVAGGVQDCNGRHFWLIKVGVGVKLDLSCTIDVTEANGIDLSSLHRSKLGDYLILRH